MATAQDMIKSDWRATERPSKRELKASVNCFSKDGSFNKIDTAQCMEYKYDLEHKDHDGRPMDYRNTSLEKVHRAAILRNIKADPLMSMLGKKDMLVGKLLPVSWLANKMRGMHFLDAFIENLEFNLGRMAFAASEKTMWLNVKSIHNGNIKTAAECILYSQQLKRTSETENEDSRKGKKAKSARDDVIEVNGSSSDGSDSSFDEEDSSEDEGSSDDPKLSAKDDTAASENSKTANHSETAVDGVE